MRLQSAIMMGRSISIATQNKLELRGFAPDGSLAWAQSVLVWDRSHPIKGCLLRALGWAPREASLPKRV